MILASGNCSGTDVFEVADAAKLGDLLRSIDARIMEAGKNKGPKNMLEHELHDGDTVEFVYGFCGG